MCMRCRCTILVFWSTDLHTWLRCGEAWTFLLAADLQLEHGNFCSGIYQSKRPIPNSKTKSLVITIGNYPDVVGKLLDFLVSLYLQ
jgi:hypothetical protein